MKFSTQLIGSDLTSFGPGTGAGVSRETWRGGLFWRQYSAFGGRLLLKSVAFEGVFRGYSMANPAEVRRAASERSALLVDVCEQLVIAHALKVPLDSLMFETRSLIEDIYAAQDSGHRAGVFGLPLPEKPVPSGETPQSEIE